MIIRKTTDEMGANTNAMLGLSGLDTASMLKSMMRPYKIPISTVTQKQQMVIWKQDRYRELIGKLNDFRAKFFDYRNPATNIASPGTWRQFIVENKDDEYVRITSTSTTKPKDGTIEYIKEPTASKIIGRDGLVGDIEAASVPIWYEAVNNSLYINMDGIVRAIPITSAILAMPNDTARVAALQSAIDSAFGANMIDIGITDTVGGRLTLSVHSGSVVNQITILDGGARTQLGFGGNSNLSNRIVMSDTLNALDYRLKESMQFKSVMVHNNLGALVPRNVVEFSINGVDFQFTSGDSMKDVMDAINNSICGVTISYDNSKDQFTLTASTCGPGETIRIQEEETNFFGALGLTYTQQAPTSIMGGAVNATTFHTAVNAHNAANPLDPFVFDVTVNGVLKMVELSRSDYADIDDLVGDLSNRIRAAFPNSGTSLRLDASGHIELVVDKTAPNAAWSFKIEENAAHATNPAKFDPLTDMTVLGLDVLQGVLAGMQTTYRFTGGSVAGIPGIFASLDGSGTPFTFDITVNGVAKQIVLDRTFMDDADLLAEINTQINAHFPNAGLTLGAQLISGNWHLVLDVDKTASAPAYSVSIGADPGDPAFLMLPTLGLDVLDTALQSFPTVGYAGGTYPSNFYLDVNASPDPFVYNFSINGVVRQIVLGRKDYASDSDFIADFGVRLSTAYPNAGLSVVDNSPPGQIMITVNTFSAYTAHDISFAPPTSPEVANSAAAALGLAALNTASGAILSQTETKIIGGVIDSALHTTLSTLSGLGTPYVFNVTVNGVERDIELNGTYLTPNDVIADVNAQLASAFPTAGFSIDVMQSNINPADWHLVFVIDKTAPNAAWSIEFTPDIGNPTPPPPVPLEADFGLAGALEKTTLAASFAGYVPGEFGLVEIDGVQLQVDRPIFEYDGVLYELRKLPPSGHGPIEYRIRTDTDKIVELVRDFVEAYNDLVRTIGAALSEKRDKEIFLPLTDEQKEQMTETEIEKWETRVKTGLLRGDPNFIGLSSKLRLMLYNPVYESYGDNKSIPFSLKKMGLDTIDMSNGLGLFNPADNGALYIDELILRHAIETNLDQIVVLFTKTPEMFVPGPEDADKPPEWHARMQRLYDDHTGGLTTKLLNIINDYARTMRGANNAKGTLIERAGIENDSSDMDNAFSRQILNYNRQINALWDRYDRIERQKIRTLSRLETIVSNAGVQMQWMQQQMGQQ
ncbi:MAG: flagellar filament capping protein FliD [Oscillospiraceae bacterium]|nr:flagellar filament capping protein FliD [Oscillospiraceae bacterium]